MNTRNETCVGSVKLKWPPSISYSVHVSQQFFHGLVFSIFKAGIQYFYKLLKPFLQAHPDEITAQKGVERLNPPPLAIKLKVQPGLEKRRQYLSTYIYQHAATNW